MKKSLFIFILLGLFMVGGSTTWAAPAQWPTYGYNLQRTGQVPFKGPEKPLVKWALTADCAIGPLLVGEDGSIYVRWPRKGSEQELRALDPEGNIKWKLKRRGTPYAIGTDGAVYSSGGAEIYVTTPNGESRDITHEQGFVDDLTVTPDGTIYSTTHEKLYALNMDGSVKWEFATNGDTTLPAVGKDGTVYLGSDENVYALNPDGTLEWKFTRKGIGFETPVIAPDGTIYSMDGQKQLYAINPDGTLKWIYEERDITYQGTHYGLNIICSEPSVAKDGTVYVGTVIGLSAVDPDGTLKWRFGIEFPGGFGAQVYAKPIIDSNGTVYFVSRDWYLYAVDRKGRLKWKFCLGGGPCVDPVISSDGAIYVASFTQPNHGRLWAISSQGKVEPFPALSAGKVPAGTWPMLGHNPQHSHRSSHIGPSEPEIKWIFTSGKISGSPVIAPDGSIYFGTDKKLYALNPDGTLKWRFDPGMGYEVKTPAVAFDGTIYVTSGRRFYVLSPDRTVREEFQFETAFYSPTIGPDGIVYLSGRDGYLYAYHPEAGFIWRSPALGDIISGPAVSPGGSIYFGSEDKNIYALNPDGSLKWRIPTGGWTRWVVIGADDTLYFYANGNIHALNPDTSVKWKFKADAGYLSAAVDSDGTVHVVSSRHKLLAIRPDGTLKWRFEIEGWEKIIGTGLAIDSEGGIYFGSSDKHIYAVSSSGTLKWKLKLEDEVYSPVIDAQGILYVPVSGGKLYAISSK